MTDCKKAPSLSGSSWTFVWATMSLTWIRSYHACCSEVLRRFCDSRLSPKKCLFLFQARPTKHPRRNVGSLFAHVHRQWVSCKMPGHNGRCLGPRLRTWGCGFAYHTSKKFITSSFLFLIVSHASWSSSPELTAKSKRVTFLRFLSCTPQIILHKRLVFTRPAPSSVIRVSTQSPHK